MYEICAKHTLGACTRNTQRPHHSTLHRNTVFKEQRFDKGQASTSCKTEAESRPCPRQGCSHKAHKNLVSVLAVFRRYFHRCLCRPYMKTPVSRSSCPNLHAHLSTHTSPPSSSTSVCTLWGPVALEATTVPNLAAGLSLRFLLYFLFVFFFHISQLFFFSSCEESQ